MLAARDLSTVIQDTVSLRFKGSSYHLCLPNLKVKNGTYSLHTPEQTRPVIRALWWSIGSKICGQRVVSH